MIEFRKLKPSDIEEIKDDLVEGGGERLTPEIAQRLADETSYAYLKDGKVVACAGCGYVNNETMAWAIYSNKFSPITRARAAKYFMEIGKVLNRKITISIPSGLSNGEKYAEFIGFNHTKDDIYEAI